MTFAGGRRLLKLLANAENQYIDQSTKRAPTIAVTRSLNSLTNVENGTYIGVLIGD